MNAVASPREVVVVAWVGEKKMWRVVVVSDPIIVLPRIRPKNRFTTNHTIFNELPPGRPF